jgi:hypothetical protein
MKLLMMSFISPDEEYIEANGSAIDLPKPIYLKNLAR